MLSVVKEEDDVKHWFSFLLIFVLLCAGLYGWGAAQPTDLQRAARNVDRQLKKGLAKEEK